MIAAIDTDRFRIVTVSDATLSGAGALPAWAARLGWPVEGDATVPLAARSRTERKIWAARLDQAIRAADRRVLLVAEGVGCAASAWWARLSPRDDVERVAGAVLFDRRGEDDRDALFASPAIALPFPSLLLDRRDSGQDDAAALARWSSRVVAAPRAERRATSPVPAPAQAWRQAQRLFLRLTSHVVEQDIARDRALRGL